ncbi:uncharacterized conserved secreted protein (DUF218) [Synechococcus sp. PROS-7-1]|uniref:YdcF family protein n=1 Tax=Synechococcus sp. PROS-7-1 TaxID=1442556 RepID=UPI001646DD32|nr:YdcF family protein [Synechococcus sp. PROS-7-1]QNI86312.1 uncharacterized conserved secreted protein (DUF218) [Synechococcus sp. PROS-7-1]
MGLGIRSLLLVSALVGGAALATPLRPFTKAALTRQNPQRILVLGGDADRERIGLRLARQLELPLVVSGGTNPEYAQWLMEHEGLGKNEVRLDYRAQDTLGNFTSLVDELEGEGVEHVLLVTSEDHLPRAMIVGGIVAGSRGIRLTGVPVSCAERCRTESMGKRWGDGLRALAWVISGRDLKPWALRQWPELFSQP